MNLAKNMENESLYMPHACVLKVFLIWKLSIPVLISLAAFLYVFLILSSQHEEQVFTSVFYVSKNL